MTDEREAIAKLPTGLDEREWSIATKPVSGKFYTSETLPDGVVFEADSFSAPTEEQRWEYGWVSRFEDGEEYEWLDCSSREEAERQIAMFQDREDADTELPGRLTYSLRRRRVTEPGPWEPVE